jgi:hypothetical protein
MARIVELLEIDLSGTRFRLEVGGAVALSEGDAPVAVVRLDSLPEAERLEALAHSLRLTFRWQPGHDASHAVSVDSFESTVAGDPRRYQPIDDVGRAQHVVDPKEPICKECGNPESYLSCWACGPIDYNYPGKHD